MTLYEDYVGGGQWYHCAECNTAGDMIQLASRAWNLSLEATAMKLIGSGFELPRELPAITKYIEEHVRPQEALTGLWTQAQTGLANPSGELSRLLHRFNLHCNVPPDRRLAGPGSLLGGISTTEVERAFAPAAMDHADEHGQQSNPSEHAVFRGAGWHDTLAMPFYDLPQRICAFLFIGREGEYPADFIFRRANRGFRGNQWGRPAVEAGIAMHPLALQESLEWDRTVLALGKPLLALSLQMRHFERSQRPLPIAVWYDSITRKKQHGEGQRVRTINAWEMLGNQPAVFWMPTFCASTVQQAIAVNGLISTVGPRSEGPDHLQEYIWKYSPRDLVKHLMHSAVEWPNALERSFGTMSSAESERALRKLHAYGADISQISRRCSSTIRPIAAQVFTAAGQRSAKLCGGPVIIERAGCWYSREGRDGKETLISDGILRMDRLLNHRGERKTYIRGQIEREGKVVEFCEPMERIDRGGLRWMREVLIQRGIGCLSYNPKFQRRLLAIAQLFQESPIADAVTAVGWNERGLQFVLPQFAVCSGGVVGSADNAIFASRPPARCVYPPEDLTSLELDRGATDDDPTPLFWAVLGCMVANIIAPSCHAVPSGIGLVGEGARTMGEALAAAVGCWVFNVENAKDIRQALAAEHAHGWPVYVRHLGRPQLRTRRLLLRGKSVRRNILTPLNLKEALEVMESGGWQVVRGDTPVACPDSLLSYARKFVPAYLKRFCANHMSLNHWNNPLASHVQEVLRDMARFIKELEGEPDVVLAANGLLSTGAKAVELT
jgi:hypothetical protein